MTGHCRCQCTGHCQPKPDRAPEVMEIKATEIGAHIELQCRPSSPSVGTSTNRTCQIITAAPLISHTTTYTRLKGMTREPEVKDWSRSKKSRPSGTTLSYLHTHWTTRDSRRLSCALVGLHGLNHSVPIVSRKRNKRREYIYIYKEPKTWRKTI